MTTASHFQKRVSYYYDDSIGDHHYGSGHPMKPQRIRMTHNLVVNYGLYQRMEIYRPCKAPLQALTTYHSEDYVAFLSKICPELATYYEDHMLRCHIGEDCPIFPGLFDFCQLSAGGSIAGANKLNAKETDIAINWSGGLHHARKSYASGFCYINDIVLAILELLKYHQRVLYIDIDIHHGDGVEEAFINTDRVMTVSFHKYGKFFPGTGSLNDIGSGAGKFYSVNFPLKEGIDDESYESIFAPVITKVMEVYRPHAIVLQSGADSLTQDRLGCFNLTLKGHAKCLEFVMKYNLPLLLLGGGGYTIRNVARCWTYETAVALGVEIPNTLPYNDYFEYYKPKYRLHLSPSKLINMNSKNELLKTQASIFENLRSLQGAPSVPFEDISTDTISSEDEAEDLMEPNERTSITYLDKRVAANNELSDSDDEGDGRKDQKTFKTTTKTPSRNEDGPNPSKKLKNEKSHTEFQYSKPLGSQNIVEDGTLNDSSKQVDPIDSEIPEMLPIYDETSPNMGGNSVDMDTTEKHI